MRAGISSDRGLCRSRVDDLRPRLRFFQFSRSHRQALIIWIFRWIARQSLPHQKHFRSRSSVMPEVSRKWTDICSAPAVLPKVPIFLPIYSPDRVYPEMFHMDLCIIKKQLFFFRVDQTARSQLRLFFPESALSEAPERIQILGEQRDIAPEKLQAEHEPVPLVHHRIQIVAFDQIPKTLLSRHIPGFQPHRCVKKHSRPCSCPETGTLHSPGPQCSFSGAASPQDLLAARKPCLLHRDSLIKSQTKRQAMIYGMSIRSCFLIFFSYRYSNFWSFFKNSQSFLLSDRTLLVFPELDKLKDALFFSVPVFPYNFSTTRSLQAGKQPVPPAFFKSFDHMIAEAEFSLAHHAFRLLFQGSWLHSVPPDPEPLSLSAWALTAGKGRSSISPYFSASVFCFRPTCCSDDLKNL